MRSEENEQLTRTGPGTVMGQFLRQYWMPVAASEELEPGGAPLRLRLLSEDFIAFRSPDGKVGVIDHQCAHRCASLFYGRNEEGGIRCVYHGWKFDTSGQCVEMPSEPPETDYKEGVKIRALPAQEAYGALWVYMGPRETPPALPHFDLDTLADVEVGFLFRECNWLQALEGDVDTCHVGFLHGGGFKPEQFVKGSVEYYRNLNRAPKYEVLETPYGGMYTAYRPAGEDETYYRVGQFALPFWTAAPPQPMGGNVSVRAWVPLDDEHCMLVTFRPRGSLEKYLPRDKEGKVLETASMDFLPNTTDWFGRWRIKENVRNDHLINRDLQKGISYSGVVSIPVQDQAVTESMGPIVDRTKEHLGTSDVMIVFTRRRLLRAALALRDEDVIPPGAEDLEVYRGVRAGHYTIANTIDWVDEFNTFRKGWGAEPLQITSRRRKATPAAPNTREQAPV